MVCKGICERHRAFRPPAEAGVGRYSLGQKRCQTCMMFMNWPGVWCPCCGLKLRSHPRNANHRSKLRNKHEKPLLVFA
ncbi:MAG: hypothetical protein E6K88_02810 [Thaumarchaeota archaeon]|nr:MAG: hypothetical protein E6K92_03405 [Nitrososphaerota archaeon]TLY10763.1 MAG: hypothetical protein E6K85_02785 [Nitrososphaerota archaeon]TLY10935.1 MAG: hypothetical protein E6K88_02810 [Nitrososphaerota archaeon]